MRRKLLLVAVVVVSCGRLRRLTAIILPAKVRRMKILLPRCPTLMRRQTVETTLISPFRKSTHTAVLSTSRYSTTLPLTRLSLLRVPSGLLTALTLEITPTRTLWGVIWNPLFSTHVLLLAAAEMRRELTYHYLKSL